MEIIITIGIVGFAILIFYRKSKEKSCSDCGFGSCSSHCPLYAEHMKNVKK